MSRICHHQKLRRKKKEMNKDAALRFLKIVAIDLYRYFH
jgi:hypothetical protein